MSPYFTNQESALKISRTHHRTSYPPSGCKLTELKEKNLTWLKRTYHFGVSNPQFSEVRNLPDHRPCHWRKWFESLAGIHASVEADDICFQLLQPFDQRDKRGMGFYNQKVGGSTFIFFGTRGCAEQSQFWEMAKCTQCCNIYIYISSYITVEQLLSCQCWKTPQSFLPFCSLPPECETKTDSFMTLNM